MQVDFVDFLYICYSLICLNFFLKTMLSLDNVKGGSLMCWCHVGHQTTIDLLEYGMLHFWHKE